MVNNNTFKKHKVGNFTVIDNNIFKNKEMSLKSKGLLALMLSLADDWEFSERGLTALSKDGRDSIRSGLKELEDLGYLVRKTIRSESGQFLCNQYNVYELPLSVVDYPMFDKPLLGNPTLVIPPNKELSNKELTNKELKDIKDYVHFDEFWELYPRKTNKSKAKVTFNNMVRNEDTFNQIKKDLQNRKGFDDWKKDNGKYIPHPTTYLNGKRWEDEYNVKKVNHDTERLADKWD